uniref:Uncharacterized protein n=1 Tax=Caenorhabditis japonica TaxID=281687 RepID=A0A8R1E3T1_CAEJA
MKLITRTAKPGPTTQRSRTHSGTSLGPREELLRESIRDQVASVPYAYWTHEETWDGAKRIAASLQKKPEVVLKAIYNRRNFVNRKIGMALVKFEVVDINSPQINDIADMVQTIACNVIHFLQTHREKISAEILAKHVSVTTKN